MSIKLELATAFKMLKWKSYLSEKNPDGEYYTCPDPKAC